MYYDVRFHLKYSIWTIVLGVVIGLMIATILEHPLWITLLTTLAVFILFFNTLFFKGLLKRYRFKFLIYVAISPLLVIVGLLSLPILIIFDIYAIISNKDRYLPIIKSNLVYVNPPISTYFEDASMKKRIEVFQYRMNDSSMSMVSILVLGIMLIVVSFHKFSLWIIVLSIIVECILYIVLATSLGRKLKSETEKFFDILLVEKDGATICHLFKLLVDKYYNNQFIISSYILFVSEQQDWDELARVIEKYKKYSSTLNYRVAYLKLCYVQGDEKQIKVLIRDIDMELIRRISVSTSRKDYVLLKKEVEWLETQDLQKKLLIANEMKTLTSNPFEEVDVLHYIARSYELLGDTDTALNYYEEILKQGNTLGVVKYAREQISKIQKSQD